MFANMLTILPIAIGLAMDAFAASIGRGAGSDHVKVGQALKAALFFGGFQAIMPLIGWVVGSGFERYITAIDHWVAFGLLSFIGLRMIYESRMVGTERRNGDFFATRSLLTVAVATSIDALVVGVSLVFLGVSIPLAVAIIGLVTFGLSLLGIAIGRTVGRHVQSGAEIAGGLILIAIGARILVSHLG